MASFLSQQGQEGPDDAVGGAAIHHALADDDGQGDDDADVARCASERDRHAADLVGELTRRQQAYDNGGGQQGKEGVHPQGRNHEDDREDPDGEDEQWFHGAFLPSHSRIVKEPHDLEQLAFEVLQVPFHRLLCVGGLPVKDGPADRLVLRDRSLDPTFERQHAESEPMPLHVAVADYLTGSLVAR